MYDRKIDTFITVAEHGNLTAAARAMFITQPVVSTQIKSLEKDLGAQLFTRSKKGVELTSAGEAFLRRALEIRELCNRAIEEVRQAAEGESKTVRFVAAESMSSDLSAQACALFRKAHPDCRIEFVYRAPGGPSQLFDLLLDKTADLAMTTEDPEFLQRGLSFQPLRKVPLLCVMSQEHPLAERESIGAEDLLPYNVNLYGKGHSAPTDHLWRLFAERGARERIVAKSWIPLQEIESSTTITLFAESLPQFQQCAVVPLDDSVPKLVQGLAYRPDANQATRFLGECLTKVYGAFE